MLDWRSAVVIFLTLRPMAWIRHIPPSRAGGRLAGVYKQIRADVPRVPNLMQVFSLRPETMENIYRSWLSSMWSGSVTRQTKELLALVVSRSARCDYCSDSNLVFLQASGMDGDKAFEVEQHLAETGGLPEKLLVALRFAVQLTADPRAIADEDREALRKAWPVAEERVEAVAVMAGFNCITRIANGLGVALEIPTSFRRFDAGRRGAISLLSRLTALSVDLAEKSIPARLPDDNLRALDFLFLSQLGFPAIPRGFRAFRYCPELFDGQLRLMEKAVAVVPRDRWMRIGLVVGRLTGCDYFGNNCAAWLEQRGVEPTEVVAASEGAPSSVADGEKYCLRFARDLTLHSHTIDEARIRELRGVGFSDGAILDLTFVAAVFNGMARLAVALEHEGGEAAAAAAGNGA